MKSTLRCPVCGNPLNVERHPDSADGYYILWCGVGRCPSYAANQGGSGPTELAAFEELDRCVVEEVLEATPQLSPQEELERRYAILADHANDLKRQGD